MFRKRRVCFKKPRQKANCRKSANTLDRVFGNGFTPGKYDTEEEEVLLWSLTSLQAPLNDPAYKRYEELFCRLLPEKAKILFPEMDDKNAA